MRGKENLIMAMLLVVLGVLFIALKGGVISIAATIMGVALIMLGVIDLINKNETPGIVKIIFGAVLIVLGWVVVHIMLYVLAVLLIAYGTYQIYLVFKDGVKNKDTVSLVLQLVLPVLSIIAGILLFFNTAAIFIICGIILIIEGLIVLADEYYLS